MQPRIVVNPQIPYPTKPQGVAEDAVPRYFRVPAEQARMRLDVFLANNLRNTSRTRARLIGDICAYDGDGKKLRGNERVRIGTVVALWRSPVDEEPEDIDIPVLYEDDYILAIDKSPHLTVHPTARHMLATVTHLLNISRPTEKNALIHRLDRETSGVLLIARTTEADRVFKRMLEDRSLENAGYRPFSKAEPIKKVYLAICHGNPEEQLINLPIERDPDNSLKVKMRIATGEEGQPSQTKLYILDQTEGYSYVMCELLTGRQHQIRLHLSAIGFPLVGDKLYGPDERMHARGADGVLTEEDIELLEIDRQALHAYHYALPHPLLGVDVSIFAPFPEDLADFWERKSGRRPNCRPEVRTSV